MIGVIAAVAALAQIDRSAAFEVSGFTFDDFTYHGHEDWGSSSDGDSPSYSGGSGQSTTTWPTPSYPPLPVPPPAESARLDRLQRADDLEHFGERAYRNGQFSQALKYYQQAYDAYEGEASRAELLERIAWTHAAMAQQLGDEYGRRGLWRQAIEWYQSALSQCGGYCDEIYRNGMLANIAAAEANLEWEAGVALWDREEYEKAAAAFARSAAAIQRALNTYPGDASLQQNLRLARGSAAWAQAGALQYDAKNAKDRLRYLEEAHGYLPEDEELSKRLDRQRAFVADEDRRQQRARVEEARFSTAAPKIQQAADQLAQSVKSGGGEPVAGRQGSAFFGVPGNPSGLTFLPASTDQATTSTTKAQASSAQKSGAAATAASTEKAHALSACALDRAACVGGEEPPPVNVGIASSSRPVQAAAFPGLSKDDWTRLQGDDEGRNLIKRADDLVQQQANLTKTIDQIRAGGNTNEAQQAFIEADKKLRDVDKRIDKLRNDAKRIIDRVVLDPTPAKKP